MMQAIHYWMNYTCKVSKIDLLAEASIRFPLMEYIERYLNAEHFYLERKYEDILSDDIFNITKKADIMWEMKDVEYVMELKYISNDTGKEHEKQRYFNDLVRLSLALELSKAKERKCYFLVCGNAQDFGDQMCGRIKSSGVNDVGNSLKKEKSRKQEIRTEFANWFVLKEMNKAKNHKNDYKHIVYGNNKFKTRFEKFVNEYFKIDAPVDGEKKTKRKKDKSENIKYLCSFYTKRVWLNYIDDEKMAGLWEVVLEKNDK